MDTPHSPQLPSTTGVQLAVGATAVATVGVLVLVARDQAVVDAWHEAAPAVRNLLSAIATSWHRNGGASAIVLRG